MTAPLWANRDVLSSIGDHQEVHEGAGLSSNKVEELTGLCGARGDVVFWSRRSCQLTVSLPHSALTLANASMLFPQKKSKDHFGLEGDEESTMLEDSVSPKK